VQANKNGWQDKVIKQPVYREWKIIRAMAEHIKEWMSTSDAQTSKF
jgi:hypothetical protein